MKVVAYILTFFMLARAYAEAPSPAFLGKVSYLDTLAGISEPLGAGPPGGLGGVGIFLRGKTILCGNLHCFGSELHLQALAGIPTLRLRLELSTPSFIIHAFQNRSIFYYTPMTSQGLFTLLRTEDVPVMTSPWANSYQVNSTRLGYRWGKNFANHFLLSWRIEAGLEAGYLATSLFIGPSLGGVVKLAGAADLPVIFAAISLESHFNFFASLSQAQIMDCWASAGVELGWWALKFPGTTAGLAVGVRAQADYFNLNLTPPGTSGFPVAMEALLFLRMKFNNGARY